MSEAKSCSDSESKPVEMRAGGERRSKKGGFLRGVLVGWRSSVASSSVDHSPSHSTSCPSQLTPGTPIRETADSPTLDKALEVTAGDNPLKLDLTEPEERMRMTPSPAPESVPVVKAGFLHQPTALAFDPIQRLVAIGNRSGFIRIVGWKRDAEIDSHVRHPTGASVIQLEFVVNEGLLISMNSDDAIHLWNYKLKLPELINSLKFTRERLSVFHLPFQSKWMYIGTEKGNTHVANTDSFLLSGYVINWNKAIDLAQKTHPGSVVHLSDCPVDPNKLLIGFDSGLVVFWDLRNRSADSRFSYHVALTSISWHHEGRQFLCSHTDGSFTTWDLKSNKPVSVLYPHARTITDDLKIEPCSPIFRIELKTCKNDEPFTVFSGGLPSGSIDTSASSTPPTTPTTLEPDPVLTPTASSSSSSVAATTAAAPTTIGRGRKHVGDGSTQSLTVIHGKTTTVLEMKSNIVSFVSLSESPYDCDFSDPYAVLVLQKNDLVVVDLSGARSNDGTEDLSSVSDGPKYTVTSALPDEEPEQIGSLFIPNTEMPEAPKQGFFKGLFSGSPSVLDREELFGEQMSGKGSKSVAKQIPGAKLDMAKAQTGSLAAELSKTRQALSERGEHLERLEDRTERMANEAEGFRDLSHQLLNKYKDKKWYQF